MDNSYTIIDYLKIRGDITFNESAFNEIDSLIMCQLSYVDFDGLKIEGKKIEEIFNEYIHVHNIKEDLQRLSLISNNIYILQLMASSNRFKGITIYNYVNDINLEQEKQFSAYAAKLGLNDYYIAFKGTDDTIVGWKEDLNMTYTIIPSQTAATKYLNNFYLKYLKRISIFSKLKSKITIRCGGHSKGGNIAIYGATHTNQKMMNNIISVDNFDGPGFDQQIINEIKSTVVYNKVTNYLPSGSVFGMLLNHNTRIRYVNTTINNMMQHSGLYWIVNGSKFDYANDLDESNKKILEDVNSILEELSYKERKELIDQFFDIFSNAGITNINDLSSNKYNTIISSIQGLKSMNEKYRKVVLTLLTYIFKLNTNLPVK
ncbi:MAG: DUF2974 domain-containing protein [Thomasclavelia sp.]|nr:DUF2974 domain-containing protein [Thomasclavelia sp.]